MNSDKNNKFVLSKGHASLGLYAILEHFGIINENLDNFCKFRKISDEIFLILEFLKNFEFRFLKS